MSPSRLVSLVAGLHAHHGDPFVPPTDDPFELILWEQVGYLADDDRRATAFDRLRREVGLAPGAVAGAPLALLETVARTGGSIAVTKRAERMQSTARVTIEEWDGDLARALDGDARSAHRVMKRFPMIGAPGADKILMLTRTHPVLALDSNGLRVLLRIGYGEEGKIYASTYRNVQEAIATERPDDFDWLIRAYGLLRRHGQSSCRRSSPACSVCPVRRRCAHGGGRGGHGGHGG